MPNAVPTSVNLAVTVDEDTSYTFQTGDFAFADEDDGDVLASVKITALPAAGTLALDGTAVTADQEIAASDLGKLDYTPAADANDPGYASFAFKVSDGTSESAAPYTVTIDVTAVNDAATGAPTITGTARVGQVLTADASGIADVDGLPAASTFAWQWLQVDSGSDTVIAGATAGTYRLAAGDAGKKFKVRVGFTDLDGTAEALTSAAYPASQSVEQNAAPTSANLAVTVDEDTSYTFRTGDFAFADTDGDVLVSVKLVTLPARAGTLALGGVPVRANQVIGTSDLGKLVYTPAADANDPGYASFTFKVSDGTSESAAPYTVTIDVTAVNDAATGAPTISGTARVGQVLTADASGIADVDGLPAASTFAWQWLQVDSGSDTVIAGATARTYRLVAGDAGKKFKVRVGFTDLDGTAEALTSAAYPASQSVEQNAAPTSANLAVTVDEDTSYTFRTGDFAFADEDDGDVLASVKITALPAAGTLALDGTAVTADQVIAASDLGKLVYTPPADANDPGYASFTFKVSDGTSESAAPYTVTINVTAVNDAATGAPTITGTARVGQVLTADASGIADVDGLPAASTFAWQWLQVDSGSDTVIAGATAGTYRLAAGDAGKKFKVRVGFTDLDGTAEALTSAAYPAALEQVVPNAVPTSVNLAVTVDEDTSYTFQTGDFAFADGDDGDVLASVKITALPAAGTLALDGTAVTADQVIAASDLGKLDLHAGCGRERPGLRLVHLQGERRDVRERGALHGDDRRDGCERRCDGSSDDLGDGACGSGPDGGGERDRGCGRVACALGVRLAVAAGR